MASLANSGPLAHVLVCGWMATSLRAGLAQHLACFGIVLFTYVRGHASMLFACTLSRGHGTAELCLCSPKWGVAAVGRTQLARHETSGRPERRPMAARSFRTMKLLDVRSATSAYGGGRGASRTSKLPPHMQPPRPQEWAARSAAGVAPAPACCPAAWLDAAFTSNDLTRLGVRSSMGLPV